MKQKVLIFIDWFAPGYKAGGPITSNVNIVEHLGNEVEFYVITSSFDYHATEPYNGIEENKWVDYKGAKVMYISPKNVGMGMLKKAAKEASCDVWYINGIYSRYYSIYPLILAKVLKPKKVIVSARGMLSPHALAVKSGAKNMYLTLAKGLKLYKNVTFHTTNEEEGRYAQQVISENNPVAVAENLPRKMNVQTCGCPKMQGELRLVSFARVSPEKNTLFAIRALKDCKQKVVYDIYGQVNNEEYWQKCKDAINELPENVKVNYQGSVSPSEMPAIYTGYHALYLPSTGENYGHAILESFMNACPVVISNKTPWLGLEAKKIGWDLPLDESLYAPIIDRMAMMDANDFADMRKSVNTFITDYLANNETRKKYLKMFAL